MAGTQQPPARTIERAEVSYCRGAPGRTRDRKTRALPRGRARASSPGCSIDTHNLLLWHKRLQGTRASFWHCVYLINAGKSSRRECNGGKQSPTRVLKISEDLCQRTRGILGSSLDFPCVGFLWHGVDFVDMREALT